MHSLRFALLTLVFAGFCINAQNDPHWNEPVEPFQIIGNVHYVGARDLTSYLITTPAGHIVLDGGLAETAPQIERNIATLGFKLSDVKWLINSHAHFDHAAGLATLKRKTGAKLAAIREDAELLARGGRNDFHFGDKLAYDPVEVDRMLKDGDRVELGGVVLTAHHTPGHTKGNTTWTMTVREGERDYRMVFVASTSTLDYPLSGNPAYPSIADDYRKTFQKLKQLPCDVFLGPHASFYDMAGKLERRKSSTTNPFIDPGGYRRYIDSNEKTFKERLKSGKSR